MHYGYARVSTEDQSLEIQLDELRRAGCDDIRFEKVSGSTIDGRPEFSRLLAQLKSGDELWVVRIDRFARSLTDLANLVEDFRKKGIALKATQQPIDTASASGRAFLQMCGVFAEFERSITAERRAAGIAKAKLDGAYARCGRPKIERDFDVGRASMLQYEFGAAFAAAEMGVPLSTFYKLVKEAA